MDRFEFKFMSIVGELPRLHCEIETRNAFTASHQRSYRTVTLCLLGENSTQSMIDPIQFYLLSTTSTSVKEQFNCIKPVFRTRLRTELIVALSPLKNMLDAVSRFFALAPSTIDVAGCKLTHDVINQLIEHCTVLKRTLTTQREALRTLHAVSKQQESRRFHQIQTRHVDIKVRLNAIISTTQHSTEPWVHEIADAEIALREKIVTVNRQSRVTNWKEAARIHWPRIAETYAWLLPLVQRLQEALVKVQRQSTESKTTGIPLDVYRSDDQRRSLPSTREQERRIRFGEESELRMYEVGGLISEQNEGSSASVATKVTDGKKKAANRRFKGADVRYKAGSDVVSGSDL